MADTAILPPITFQQGKYWFRFKTVTEAVGGMGKMLEVIDDESPEGERLLSCRRILLKYGDAPAPNLPDSERAQVVEALQLFGTVHSKWIDREG